MNAHRCCELFPKDPGRELLAARVHDDQPRPSPFARRCLKTAGWVVPSAILAILPKCPACLAAYLAIGTGIGLSISTAAYLRAALVIMCGMTLICFAVKLAWKSLFGIGTNQ